jgi:hypothetical protein
MTYNIFIGRMIKISVLYAGFVIPFLFSVSCASEKPNFRTGRNSTPEKAIEAVLKERTKELMSIPGVVGTGQGLCDDKPCIKVLVVKETPEVDQKIPRMLEGYPVVIEETGKIRARPNNKTDK